MPYQYPFNVSKIVCHYAGNQILSKPQKATQLFTVVPIGLMLGGGSKDNGSCSYYEINRQVSLFGRFTETTIYIDL